MFLQTNILTAKLARVHELERLLVQERADVKKLKSVQQCSRFFLNLVVVVVVVAAEIKLML